MSMIRVPTCKYKTISFLDHNIEYGGVQTDRSPIFIVFLLKIHVNWLFFSTETCVNHTVFLHLEVKLHYFFRW